MTVFVSVFGVSPGFGVSPSTFLVSVCWVMREKTTAPDDGAALALAGTARTRTASSAVTACRMPMIDSFRWMTLPHRCCAPGAHPPTPPPPPTGPRLARSESARLAADGPQTSDIWTLRPVGRRLAVEAELDHAGGDLARAVAAGVAGDAELGGEGVEATLGGALADLQRLGDLGPGGGTAGEGALAAVGRGQGRRGRPLLRGQGHRGAVARHR